MAEIDPDERDLLVEGAKSLAALGEEVTRPLAAAEEVMVGELSAIQPGTIDNVRWSFIQLLDTAPAYFLVRYLSADLATEIMELFLEVTDAGPARTTVEAELRRLQALFGQRMTSALRTWNTTPDDWSGTTREVLYDVIAQQYRIQFEITKYSGEELSLVCEPGSLLNLTTNLLKTLNLVPDTSLFTDSLATEFRSEAERLLGALGPADENRSNPASTTDPAESPEGPTTATPG
jgi:hypothetical protein